MPHHDNTVVKWPPEYLLQTREGGSCCGLYTLVNAARFFMLPTPEPGTDEWEELVDMAMCRHGSALQTGLEKVAAALDLERIPLEPTIENIKGNVVEIWVVTPEPVGSAFHRVLVVGWMGQFLRMINYRWVDGPVISLEELELPPEGTSMRQVWKIRPLRTRPQ